MQKLLILLVSSGIQLSLIAQNTLPLITVRDINGNNIISWVNSYKASTAINIQRSFDSTENFITIGIIPVVKAGSYSFTDDEPKNAKAFYRLLISFEDGGYLFTASYSSKSHNSKNAQSKQDTIKTILKDTVMDSWTIARTEVAFNIRQLDDVRVLVKMPLVEQDIDKLTYHVFADPESKTMSSLDILRKIPLVNIDADDNIQVNGSSNFLVLVNGRRSSLFVRSPKDVFKSMPANSIRDIEIITNPSSRYEAEGVGGIINVITNKRTVNGYNGSANMMAGSPKSFSTTGNLTAKTKKFGFSGYLGSSDLLSRTNSNLSRENFNQKNILQQSGESQTNNSSRYLGAEFSYEFDSLNLITTNYRGSLSEGDNNFSQDVKLRNINGIVTEEYGYINDGETKWTGNDFGVDYQRNFRKSNEQLLTLSYQLSNSLNTSTSNYTQQKANNNIQTNHSDNEDNYTEHTAQADYLYAFKDQTVEMGIKSIFRINTSDYSYKTQFPGSSVYIFDSSLGSIFNYRQFIYATYASLTLKRNSLGLKIGARLEKTDVNARFISTRSIAKQNYLNVIPNITLSQKLKGPGMIKVSFTQRIERPGLYYLNPYIDVSDPKNISYGNPDIRPAVNNVIYVTYNTFRSGSSIHASVFHNFTNNPIQRFTMLGADSVAKTTFENIGKSQASGISLNGMATVFKSLSLNVNSTATYINLAGFINGHNQNNAGIMFNVFAYCSYHFDKSWRASGNIGYGSPNILLQGKGSGYTWNSISIQKDLLRDNHASVSLSVTSPFSKYRRFFSEVHDPEFHLLQESYSLARRLNLSLNYRFGKLQADIVRKKRGIKNDDLKSGDQQNTRN